MEYRGPAVGYWYLVTVVLGSMECAFRSASYFAGRGAQGRVTIEVKKELQAIPAVQDIHELHIWCTCSNIYALSTHALIHDSMANQFEKTLKEIKRLLADKFNIKQTIQFETHPCEENDSLCDISH
jgi:cobalt-zinc-cadmium efflux system protein